MALPQGAAVSAFVADDKKSVSIMIEFHVANNVLFAE